MMTSSNGNIFRVTSPLCGEFTGNRWIPLTKASDAELWCFLWSAPWIDGWVNNREDGDLRRHHAWRNDWVNNGDTGDLRRHRAHYDVTVMAWWHHGISVLLALGAGNLMICGLPSQRELIWSFDDFPVFYIFPFPVFFLNRQRRRFPVEYYAHILQALPQLSHGDTCQIYMRFTWCNM